MALTTDEVRHIAHLARLKLSDAEITLFQSQLSHILDYIAQLNELDTGDVEPTAHPLPVRNVFRDDVPQPSVAVETVLSNAPRHQEGFFAVPKVLDQGEA